MRLSPFVLPYFVIAGIYAYIMFHAYDVVHRPIHVRVSSAPGAVSTADPIDPSVCIMTAESATTTAIWGAINQMNWMLSSPELGGYSSRPINDPKELMLRFTGHDGDVWIVKEWRRIVKEPK